MHDPKPTRGGSTQPPLPAQGQSEPATPNDQAIAEGEDEGEGGMIGEGTNSQPVADITETEPRTSRPGGMIAEVE